MRKLGGLLLMIFVPLLCLKAQPCIKKCTAKDSIYCKPGVEGASCAKGIVFQYELLPRYGITTTSSVDSIPGGVGKVQQNRRINLKAKVPLLNKDHLKILLGLKYAREQFKFSTPQDLGFELYHCLLYTSDAADE